MLFLRSVRWRLTLTYVALLAVLLAGFAVYQYSSLRQSLIAARVTSLQDDMNTARLVLARTPTQGSPRSGVLCTTTAGITLPARAVATTAAATSGHTISVVVYDTRLQPVAQAPTAGSLPHLSPSSLQRALGGVRSDAEVVRGADGQDLLLVGFPVRQGVATGHWCGVAQLSTTMSPVQTVLRDEVLMLGIGAGSTLVLALVIGVLLTGRALRPLRRLTVTSRRLAGGDLRARSGVEDRNDEIGVLARSFDDMAERIERSFTAQRESEERTRRFIADASHELRTPVTALTGYIDVIRRGATPSPEALDAALGAMGREAERLRTLVLDLLTLARLDAQRAGHPDDVDLSEAVGRHLDDDLPGMPPVVVRQLGASVVARVDHNAVDSIIGNLMVNACKYAPGSAQTWRTWEANGRAFLAVADQGPGVSAADLPHIFERFYRGEKARARLDGGSGLGLSIVQALARANGGDAALSSAAGQGTTVVVEFPAATPPPPPPDVRG